MLAIIKAKHLPIADKENKSRKLLYASIYSPSVLEV